MTHDAFGRLLHRLTYWGSLAGIFVLLVRRALFLAFPGFLPIGARVDGDFSQLTRFAGWSLDRLFVVVVVFSLLGVPLTVIFMIPLRRYLKRKVIPIDVGLVSLYLILAVFLLAPPK